MIEWIKNSWKIVISIFGALMMVFGVMSTAEKIATTEDLKITKELIAKDLEKMDIKVAQAIDKVNKSVQLQFDANRFTILTDQITQYKLLLRKNPNDKELQEEYKKVIEERDKILGNLKSGYPGPR
jgi:hypothetical protein